VSEPVAIALDQVTKQYGSGAQAVTAVAEVSLEVPTG